MPLSCRLILDPDGRELLYSGTEGETWEDALLSFGINPDTVILLHAGRSIPVDREIEEGGEVTVIFTCSRG